VRHDALPALERALSEALSVIRELHAQGALPPVLEPLTLIAPPRGFAAHVELRPYTDHGRPDDFQRGGWDPRDGEVHLSFEPARDDRGPRPADRGERNDRGWRPAAAAEPPSTEQAHRDLIAVVARAEGDPSFKFLALKFLRDQLLPRHVAWAQMQNEAQIQINRAIDAGLLVTGKVENPRTPQYPVTTVALNRENGLVQEQLAALANAERGGAAEEEDDDDGDDADDGDGSSDGRDAGSSANLPIARAGGDEDDDEPS